jgi:hypothetical protein
LAEIAGDAKHPVSGETLAAMWARLEGDAGELRKVAIHSGTEIRS